MEDDFGKMLQKFNRENICPGGTHKQFIPPIFLKMNWHGKQERQALVGIYDAAGEVITESQRDAELVYYMKYMVKISTNSSLNNRKQNWIDFNCGTLVEGDTLPELAEKLFDEVIAVASGKEVKSEIAGFHDMAIFKQGVTL